VFQQLITALCVVGQNTHFICHCQLRSSRTSENCYEHFATYPIQRYQSAISQACKQFKVTQSCRSISMAWFCCL